MEVYECLTRDDRSDEDQLTVIVVSGRTRAYEMARDLLLADTHRASVEVRHGGELIFTLERADLVVPIEPPPARRTWGRELLRGRPTKH